MKNNDAYNELVGSWKNMRIKNSPYVLKEDSKILLGDKKNKEKYVVESKSFLEYIKDKKDKGIKEKDSRFHVNLLPIPYMGDLKNSDIFILQLNPGLNFGDYYFEKTNKKLRKALICNLHQDIGENEYPFLFLNPEFYWHSGFAYWYKRFQGIIIKMVKEKMVSNYEKAFFELSKRISVLQKVPYHSERFYFSKKLKSTTLISNYIEEVILPKADKKEVMLIVMRKWYDENIDKPKFYDKKAARSASLTAKEDKIFNWLKNHKKGR